MPSHAMRTTVAAAALFTALGLALPDLADARVTRIVIDQRAPEGQPFPGVGQFERVSGRAFGELDPFDRRNAIIQDILLAPRNASGKVEYVATFSLVKPIDMSKASGLLQYRVVNRGNSTALAGAGPEGHVQLVSGWQGDVTPTAFNQTIQLPIAVNPDGSPVTGPILVRFVNVSGSTSSMGNPFGGPNRYPPVTFDTTQATLTSRAFELLSGGAHGALTTIPSSDWAFADCRTVPFPGTPDPTRVCLKNGFNPALLYELVFAGKDPIVLGIGFAATRDITAFFRHALQDDVGTPNPVAGAIKHAISRGTSQSGNFIKTFIHLGFNEDESGRIVWDGAWPYIAARQNPTDFRFAIPGGAAGINEPGSEAILWWHNWPDQARNRHPGSMLDRCRSTQTCPKIFETFGSTEFWDLRMSPGLVGTNAKKDIPLPPNVYRYYYPGTSHGGGPGGFNPVQPIAGGCTLPRNPNPHSDTERALLVAFVDWVVNGVAPPPSRYPTLKEGLLVPATKAATGFPTIPFPGLPANAPDGLINSMLDYDFGPELNYNDLTGVITLQPPIIKQVLPTLVVKMDADGNEIGGVPSVVHQAPLGTYLGWNIRAFGFYAGQICDFTGGYVPFARTKTERLASGDPRPSLEERYGSQEGYDCVVARAAGEAVAERFLLQADADGLIAQAAAANILPSDPDHPVARALCAPPASSKPGKGPKSV
ncbi:MAG TPA: alpha/beta hydrolase domain-containing protein [Burkholderiaceae bacterium]|nr:alpha/beta hydrolase domain-containing protein [Burkholderiaceae bacterium]